MKKILIYGLSLVLMAVSSTSLTSCIDETQPTSVPPRTRFSSLLLPQRDF